MIPQALAAGLNHLLRGEAWTRERLKRHCGKTAQFHVPPASFNFTVLEDGELSEAAPDAKPDVVLKLTPALALRYLLRDDTAAREVEISGDSDFAADLNFVGTHLRYAVEEDLSRVFGDVIAHRLARGGARFFTWQKQSFASFAQAWSEYLSFEQPVIATRRQVEDFVREVDALRDDAERLEKRLEKLAAPVRAGGRLRLASEEP
jgi:ubiquinone biosynthesis accessory factor UbiJ